MATNLNTQIDLGTLKSISGGVVGDANHNGIFDVGDSILGKSIVSLNHYRGDASFITEPRRFTLAQQDLESTDSLASFLCRALQRRVEFFTIDLPKARSPQILMRISRRPDGDNSADRAAYREAISILDADYPSYAVTAALILIGNGGEQHSEDIMLYCSYREDERVCTPSRSGRE